MEVEGTIKAGGRKVDSGTVGRRDFETAEKRRYKEGQWGIGRGRRVLELGRRM